MKNQAKKIPPKSKVLDIGAGMCPYKKLFDHCKYTTHDFAQYSGTKTGPAADEWNYGHIDVVSDINNIPVENNSFDVIVCTEVFEHIPEPIKAIKEFSRILKKGGKLLLSAPLASGLHQEPYHFYGGFTPHFYKKFLSESSFKNVIIKPEGGLFRHVAQEIYRVGAELGQREKKHRLFGWILRNIITKIVWDLEKTIYVTEFTAGYMVEATKI
jgi:ubiquinone/menaquinone biosynthesis C-methylase UbiE